jgi:hypothetical protein
VALRTRGGVTRAPAGRADAAGDQRAGDCAIAAEAALLYLADNRQHIACEGVGGRPVSLRAPQGDLLERILGGKARGTTGP